MFGHLTMVLLSHKTAPPALGLGTVQFGLPYGVSNSVGQTSISEAQKILESGWSAGIGYLDTAQTYGSSESVLGECIQPGWDFRIVTKLSPLPRDILGHTQVVSWTRAQVLKSLQTLQCESLYGVLVHKPVDALSNSADAIFGALAECKAEGLIKKYGSSIYDRDEIEKLLCCHSLDILQIPINILDQRLLEGTLLSDLRSKGIELHARSVFLQGLLLMPSEQLSSYFDPIKPIIERLHSTSKQNRVSPMEMALAFVKSLPLDVILVGVNSHQQLVEILSAYHKVHALPNEVDFSRFSVQEDRFVNPALWQVAGH